MNKVPKLRFKEFSGEWEKFEFKNLFEEVKEKTNNIEKYRLYSLTIENGVVPKSERYQREFLVTKEDENYKIVHKNEYVYNPMNLRFGALARYMGENPVSVSGYYNIFKTVNNYAYGFLDNFLKTNKMMYIYNTIATGSLIEKRRVHFSQFIELSLPMPSIEEQQKIANFFSLIDKKIQKQQEKVEALKDYKKGMMQKIFSMEIRFKGDNGEDYPEWEEKKLGDIAEVITDYVAAGSFESIRNNVTYYDVPNFAQLVRTTDLKNQFNNTGFVFIDENAFNFLYRVNLDKEVIVLPNIGANIGESYFINPLLLPNKNNVLGPNAILLYSNINCTKYVYYLLNTRSFHIQLREMVGANGQPKFNKTELKQMKFSIPSFEEQKKICTLLTLVDQRLEKEQEKLDSLNEWKKGLLQQMFV